ncbi:MAG: hypothetical protein GY778_05895 [bacterium]|nr:hypothetical protein [bacterium]
MSSVQFTIGYSSWTAKRILSFAILLVVFVEIQPAYAGYTHYFTWSEKPDEAALADCIAEMQLIIEAKQNMLADVGGEGDPTVTSLAVQFNGQGANAHEPFVFPGEDGFNFCKTFWKPYDAVVVACLLVARDHFPPAVLKITSDGTWFAGDWSEGAALYTEVLGRPAHNPMGGGDWRLRDVVAIAVVVAVVLLVIRASRRLRMARMGA